jgi:hypothetical protein
MSTAARGADESLTGCPNAPIGPVVASPLTVLMAVPTVEVGEADEGAVELAKILGANGHRALVVSNGGRLEPGLAASGTETIRLDVTSRSPPAILHNAFALKRIIAQRRCTIIHALARAPTWSALVAARMAGVPFVTTWYNGFCEQNIFERFYNTVMTRGERVIAVSDQNADAIATRYSGALYGAGWVRSPRWHGCLPPCPRSLAPPNHVAALPARGRTLRNRCHTQPRQCGRTRAGGRAA